MHILIDMDGTIADWGKQYDADLDAIHGYSADSIPRTKDQKAFNLKSDMSKKQCKIIDEIMDRAGFYADLEPIDDAVYALKAMLEEGHEVSLVTSPWLTNPTCVQDKYDWVRKHLGDDWVDRVIITKDKTLVDGDILIDDRGDITGKVANPKWAHVIFHQPYNADIHDGRERLVWWADWTEVIPEPEGKVIPELKTAFEKPSVFTEAELPDDYPVEAFVGSAKFHTTMGEIREGDVTRERIVQELKGALENPSVFSTAKVAEALRAEYDKEGRAELKNVHDLPQFFTGGSVSHAPGEVRTTSSTGGQKGKKLAELGSLDPHALLKVAEVAGFGSQKYERLNYLKGYDWSLNFDAMQRHLLQFWAGQDKDEESGMLHLAHAAWHCLALISFIERGLGTDDRYESLEISQLQTKSIR